MSRSNLIEPGLVPVFRLFLAVQWVVLTLTLVSMLAKRTQPDALTLAGWAQATLLLPYLWWPALARRLGRAYLPLALAVTTLSPILAQAIGTAQRIAQGARGDAALIAPGILYVWLLLPTVLVAAQYGVRAVLLFLAGTSLLPIALNAGLARVGAFNIASVVSDASTRWFIFGVAGVIIARLSTAQRVQREEETRKRAQLAQYAATLEALTVSRERNRIARELHDTLAHTLSAVSVQLQALDALWERDPEAARATLRQTHALTRGGLDEARRALHELRASPLESLGLLLALRRAAEQAAERGGVTLALALPQYLPTVRAAVEQCVYRVAEEALNNAARHARARHLWLTLAADAERVRMEIVDDGAGFDPARVPPGHFGLTGLRERAALLDAQFEIGSAPGRGTRVCLTVPR